VSIAIITGSAGLIGSESALFFADSGFDIVGIDNNMRAYFFGDEASTLWNRQLIIDRIGKSYRHFDKDIRDREFVLELFKEYGSDIKIIIHTAAQPSHDWAALEPFTDFTINANGTLNLLEATRLYSPEAVFIFTSTNKVYGDRPNNLPYVETDTRFEIEPNHPYVNGISEDMSIDQSMHSLFGASKVAADILVQEYGRYFGLHTACFRGGCLSGPSHSGTKLHGFLAYLMKCAVVGTPYTIFGYKGKQVRDNIHSADLINAFWEFYQSPRIAEVYNIGGGRFSNCSMLEAIRLCEDISGCKLNWSYKEENRMGDHIWWISSLEKFMQHYPNWQIQYTVPELLREIYQVNRDRWQVEISE